MSDRKVRPRPPSQSKRHIPVRNSVAATRPLPSSKIPRAIPPGGAASRNGSKPSILRQQRVGEDEQPPPPPEPQPTPQEPPPPPPPQPAPAVDLDLSQILTPIDVDSIIPTRQARPSTASSSRRQSQPPPPPLASKTPEAAGGNPLAQPNYRLDWLPEDDQWLSKELAAAYANEALEVMKGHQLRSARQSVAQGARENEVLYEMFESGIPFEVIDRFLAKGYEEDEAEQRETEYFEKLEQMIADEADDIDLALTLSRLDMEKNPRRGGVPTLDFSNAGRVRHQKQKFQRGLLNVRRGIEAMTVLAEEDEPEEVQPELAAAMMYTEECGPGMTNPPNDMFAFLFSHQQVEAPQPPTEARPSAQEKGSESASGAPREISDPRSGMLIRETPASLQEVQSAGRLTPDLSAPQTPTHVVVGRLSAPLMPPRVQYLRRDTAGYPGRAITKRFNLIQMCGTRPPFWFRGYFEAFPHTVGRIAISNSPSTTLQTAWYVMRPETFKINRRMKVPV